MNGWIGCMVKQEARLTPHFFGLTTWKIGNNIHQAYRRGNTFEEVMLTNAHQIRLNGMQGFFCSILNKVTFIVNCA